MQIVTYSEYKEVVFRKASSWILCSDSALFDNFLNEKTKSVYTIIYVQSLKQISETIIIVISKILNLIQPIYNRFLLFFAKERSDSKF